MSSFNLEGLPPIPRIDGDVDLMLDVFTHQSLRFNPVMNNDYGDSERLAELGSKVLDMVVTYHIFCGKPLLAARDIEVKKAEVMSDENLDSWLRAYGLKDKLRISPDKVQVLQDPQEMRKFFNTYIGALYIRNGLAVVQTWISRLIEPDVDIRLPDPASPSNHYSSPPPPSHGSFQGSFSAAGYASPPSSQSSMGGYLSPSPAPSVPGYAPQPSFPPPPLPGNPPSSVPSSMSLVTLALVNQTAAQKGLPVTYQADQVGPSHQPTWTVKCFINGVEYGRGIGKSQKIAKEEAARQAWTTMGWGPS